MNKRVRDLRERQGWVLLVRGLCAVKAFCLVAEQGPGRGGRQRSLCIHAREEVCEEGVPAGGSLLVSVCSTER